MCIYIKDISKSFKNKKILSDFTIQFPEKGTVCIFGNSGSGKTTLFNIIAGIIKCDSGQIFGINDKKISFVFQEDRLIPWLSVKDNIDIVAGKKEDQHTLKVLKDFNLEEIKNKRPNELSGGMRRRAAIARAVAFNFDILLLDEPFTGLDNKTKKSVIKTLENYSKDKLKLIITHDPYDAILISDIIYIFSGPPLKIENKITIDKLVLQNKGIEYYKNQLLGI